MGTVVSRITTDRPYSAEAVNESLQILADGNKIHRTTVTRVYRDSAGRTRREMLNDDGTVRSITISDPVSKVSYTLDPATKTATKGGAAVASRGRPLARVERSDGAHRRGQRGRIGRRAAGAAAVQRLASRRSRGRCRWRRRR